MKLKFSLLNLIAAGLLVGAASSGQAQNLLTNGSFETSDFTGWNITNNSAFLTVDDGSSSLFLPSDGSYYALFGGSGDSIDQSFATTIGITYEVSFQVNDKYGGADLLVDWNGSKLTELSTSYNSGSANNGWVSFDFLVTANSTTTDLSFVNSTGSALGVDNVTIAAVPEPGTLALAGLGALSLLVWRPRFAR